MDSRQVFAKQLRRSMTDAELLLWRHLRAHRLLGAKFKRQQPLGNYIVDFVCFEATVVIEIDGGQHLESERDRQRDAWLHGRGYKVLRFWNNEVLEQTEAVLEKILQVLTPSPHPSPARGEGAIASQRVETIFLAAHAAGNPSPLAGEGQGGGGKELDRIRWRCRRGLLELDIVLGCFVEQSYAELDEAGREVFDALLDMPDTELWDMIAGRAAPAEDARALMDKIRAV